MAAAQIDAQQRLGGGSRHSPRRRLVSGGPAAYAWPFDGKTAMARVNLVKPNKVDDPAIRDIFAWVTDMEGGVPNHFYVEMNFPEYFKAKMAAVKVLWEEGELSMREIQHVGIAVSQANGCPYCTAAFCTILHHGLRTDEEYVQQFLLEGMKAIADDRLKSIVEFALKVNANPAAVTDDDIAPLRASGLTDKGIVQLVNLVSDFSSYNRLNLALQTNYDYRDLWRHLAFGWSRQSGEPEGDTTRGLDPR